MEYENQLKEDEWLTDGRNVVGFSALSKRNKYIRND